MKEAIIEAVKNTIQPTVFAYINNPDLDMDEYNDEAEGDKDSSLLSGSDEIAGIELSNSDDDTDEGSQRGYLDDVAASTFEVAPEYDVESEYELCGTIVDGTADRPEKKIISVFRTNEYEVTT